MPSPNDSKRPAIAAGTRVKIAKGCRALRLDKGVSALVLDVTAFGAEHAHAARLTLRLLNGFRSGELVTLWVRHPNRLADACVRLNKGNPLQFIELVRA
jgi:hypothetical protein